jgi:hypothetical protein
MTTIDDSRDGASIDTQTRRLLVVTQSLFFLSLAVCLLIDHGHRAQTDGISYYGVYGPTVAILGAGYTVAGVGLWRTADYFRAAGVSSATEMCLRGVSIGLFVLFVTPYNEGTFMNWTHMSAGVTGALLQLAVSWQLLRAQRSRRAVMGFSVQLLGGVLAAVSLPTWGFEVLLIGQIVYQIGFGWCLIEWTYALGEREVARP